MATASLDRRPKATPSSSPILASSSAVGRRPTRKNSNSSRRTKSPSLSRPSLASSGSFSSVILSSTSASASVPKSPSASVSTRALSPDPPRRLRNDFDADSLHGEGGLELNEITRKVVKTIEGLTGVRLDMMYFEVFGFPATSSSPSSSSPASEDGDGDATQGREGNSRGEEERQVEEELLFVGNENGRVLDGWERSPKGASVVAELTGDINDGVEKTKKKIDWEIPRKALHSSIGFLTLYLYLSPHAPTTVVKVLWAALCVIVPADVIRLRKGDFGRRFERLYERAVGWLMREGEKESTNGVIWYILGVNFALTFYPLDVAVVSILIVLRLPAVFSNFFRNWRVNFLVAPAPSLFLPSPLPPLSWADTAASTFGRLWAGHWGYYTPRLPARLSLIPFLGNEEEESDNDPSGSNSESSDSKRPRRVQSGTRRRIIRLLRKVALPLAPRKSLAGFLAASLTGATVAFWFWGWVAPMRGVLGPSEALVVNAASTSTSANGFPDVTWIRGVSGGWLEIGLLTVWAGLVSGVAEALGGLYSPYGCSVRSDSSFLPLPRVSLLVQILARWTTI
ncbi:hypothetical protein D9757_014079 [Collybiopsis confluens]|uniref:Uncharacterized protein n=1 Tax=Collybiopsis confluens TaxID=2823264 RepID=A0A8H5GDX5_9AGAR|nr:hypothetical protein D9757_014079 [Collybiopsis confluens]